MANKIKESNITDGAVTSDKIAPGTVSADRLAGSIPGSKIAPSTIDTPNIAPAAITGPLMGPAAVGAPNISPGAITTTQISPTAGIVSGQIAPGTIANDRLANTGITINGTTIALGASGDISAGTDWQSVITADGSTATTAVAGEGYFINTTSAAHTINLPASPTQGDEITIVDYAGTFGTNNVTINPNGNKIEADTANVLLSTNDQTHTLVYTDSTQGWKIINQDTASNIQASFISATGGTITTSGDYKIHTFTGDGCFVVSCAGGVGAGPSVVDYLVVAGGGGAGFDYSAGGGAGGFRESHSTPVSGCYTASPLATPTGITVSAITYPITVGAGGGATPVNSARGCSGSNSVFSTITSAGGGGGGAGGNPAVNPTPSGDGLSGGSGGGGGGFGPGTRSGGTGNTPPVSPPQGQPGGSVTTPGAGYTSAGGGGATVAGATPSSEFGTGGSDGAGGAGAGTNINPVTGESGPGCLQYYAGGGAGGLYNPGLPTSTINDGGVGGGGDASQNGSTPIPAPQ